MNGNGIDIFFKTVMDFRQSFEVTAKNIKELQKKIAEAKELFIAKIQYVPKQTGIRKKHTITRLVEDFCHDLQIKIQEWEENQKHVDIMQEVSKKYNDKLILFIYGKVNSGKSSLCNFFVDQAKKFSIKPVFFEVKNGKVKYNKKTFFKEGAIETTSEIQGVELGELVIIDSPGRQSVTEIHGELTQRYLDATDLIIWLTSSSSPGQIEELKDIADEIQKEKPFIPVITKSDRIEQDEDEKGNIIQDFIVKDDKTRRLQEEDVKKRTIEKIREIKGNPELVKPPISISVRYAKAHEFSGESLEKSGVNNFFRQLATIIGEAGEYKYKKPAQQMINYMEQIILKGIREELMPKINEIQNTCRQERRNLFNKQKQYIEKIKLEILLKLNDIIEKHKDSKNVKAIASDLDILINQAISDHIIADLDSFFLSIKKPVVNFDSGKVGDFEDITIKVPKTRGRYKQATASATGAAGGVWAGAEAGTALLGPVGGIVFGILGAIVGGKAGDAIGEEYLVEHYTITKTIGVSGEKVWEKTKESIERDLPVYIEKIMNSVIEHIRPIEAYTANLNKEIKNLENKVNRIKKSI